MYQIDISSDIRTFKTLSSLNISESFKIGPQSSLCVLYIAIYVGMPYSERL